MSRPRPFCNYKNLLLFFKNVSISQRGYAFNLFEHAGEIARVGVAATFAYVGNVVVGGFEFFAGKLYPFVYKVLNGGYTFVLRKQVRKVIFVHIQTFAHAVHIFYVEKMLVEIFFGGKVARVFFKSEIAVERNKPHGE